MLDEPATLPTPAPQNWQSARLPNLYVEARTILQNCGDIDECFEWKRRADALASYYRQAKDTTLLHLAERIRLRAMRRCGELWLEMTEEEQKSHVKRTGHRVPSIAIHAARIPDRYFEQAVEESPPRLLPSPSHKPARDPLKGTRACTDLFSALDTLSRLSRNWTPSVLIAGYRDPKAPARKRELSDKNLSQICIWLEQLRFSLTKLP